MIALLGRSLALVALGVLLGYTQNSLRADGVSLTAFEAPVSCGGTASVPHPTGSIGAAEAVTSLGAGARALVLDARDPAAYELGHVDGALHLPCAAGSADAEHIVRLAASYGRVLVYGETDASARTLADELAHRLAPNVEVMVIVGGFEALQRAGAPAGSGPCERCRVDGETP